MIILTIRTDKPEAELRLYEDQTQLAYEIWEAHRQLAETIHKKIADLLADQSKTMHAIQAIVCYEGPGSFTGLRIGLTVGNTTAYALGVPIVGTQGDDWQIAGVKRLLAGDTDTVVMPFYGADVHITLPRK